MNNDNDSIRRCGMCRKRFTSGEGYSAYPIEGAPVKDSFCSLACTKKYAGMKMQEAMDPLIQKICDMVNRMGSLDDVAEAMCKSMIHQHRYLQAEAINAFAMFLLKYGEKCKAEKLFDARNEAAVAQAERMGKAAYDFS